MAAAGAALLARSICNAPLSHLIGLRTDASDDVHVQKSIHVAAEAQEVYECWRNLEGLPRFMSHVREVRKIDDSHYHWVVDGAPGQTLEWQSEITADLPGELLAWRTMPGASIPSSGVMRFESGKDGTRVHVRMSYCPPGNALGHTVAKLLGRDPKHQMDQDLLRFKNFIEARRGTQDRPALRETETTRAAAS
ncbi:MAG TPA: SRPBCC family protein [Steroidobacter sp.]|uniref:SRPBCC family protein n=1 Tax=Steroidobacter sp. TaxID=1978227 RepID=UPI002EDBB3AD